MIRLFSALCICGMLQACGESTLDDRIQVDTILHHAKVITIDADLSIASVVAISGTDIVI